MNPVEKWRADSAPKAKRLNLLWRRVFFLLLVLFAESSVWAVDPSPTSPNTHTPLGGCKTESSAVPRMQLPKRKTDIYGSAPQQVSSILTA